MTGASDPVVASVFPSCGRQGTTVQAVIGGKFLDGSYALWFADKGLSGRILRIEEIREEVKGDATHGEKPKDSPRVYRTFIELQIEPAARLGVHSVQIVTPYGLSNAVIFNVISEPLVMEAAHPHSSAKYAQTVDLPALINGRLEKPGELDFYSVDAKTGQELSFDIVQAEGFDPHLVLYRPGGSWFDPDRPSRILFDQERTSDLMPLKAQGTFRAPQSGRYFVEVSSIFGRGSSDCTYLLRISLAGDPRPGYVQTPRALLEWQERNFLRKLQTDWATILESRSAREMEHAADKARGGSSSPLPPSDADRKPEQSSASGTRAPVSAVLEREPNDVVAQAQEIQIPAMIEGAIGHPGDLDNFRFKVSPGQKVVFEIETPALGPPQFVPRLGVLDNRDQELFSNVHRRVSVYNNNADRQVYLKGIEPKAEYTFERGGEYVLQIRDVTSRYGEPGYRYRVLVRRQIPHVGEISITDGDHINVVRGRAHRLSLTTSYEEGFTGEVSFSFIGLPDGVTALPAAEFHDDRAPTDIDENSEALVPKIQKATIVLLADTNAPLTSMPKIVQIHCRPIVGGRPGPTLLVREIPLMVVKVSER